MVMKKTYLILACFFIVCKFTNSQSFYHQFSSEIIDAQLSMVNNSLLLEGTIDSSMLLIPIFDVKLGQKSTTCDTLSKSYLKSLQFLRDNDSVSTNLGLDCFYLSGVYVFDKNTEQIFRVVGDMRFPSPIDGYSKNRRFSLSAIYDTKIYRFIAELYINKSIDFVFLYPTFWGEEKVMVDGIYFAIKNDDIYVITDYFLCSGLFLLDEFVDTYWNILIGQH